MTPQEILAAYDEQVRRHPEREGPQVRVERADGLVRAVAEDGGWAGVTWSDLDPATADDVIAEQVQRFASTRRWEWKHYSYDRPADLPERLRRAGFTSEPPETLMVAELAELDLEVRPPEGIELRAVQDQAGIEALVRVSTEVFGRDQSDLGRSIAADLQQEPPGVAAVVAMAGTTPVCAGRVQLPTGTEFASIWGGGTLPAWRRRGVFRSLVAYRARIAAEAGYRFLQVDALPTSRPILRRLGFLELATTTPYVRPDIPD